MKKVVSTFKGKLNRKGPWKNLKTLSGKLKPAAAGANVINSVFGPVASIIEGLAECIDAYESAANGRKGYDDLRNNLDSLFGELEVHLKNPTSFVMTTCMRNICDSVEKEIQHVKQRQDSSSTGRPIFRAESDADDIFACYRRIHGHLRQLSMNTGLSTWVIVDEHATETRIKSLNPSFSAYYDSSKSNKLNRGPCIPGTRVNVLETIMTWVNAPGTEAVFWLNGMAGTGKTTIAYSLCLELDAQLILGASFFCSRSSSECKDATLILPTIAYRLAEFSRPYRAVLSAVIKENPRVNAVNLSLQFKQLIFDPLNNSNIRDSLPPNVVVVIDALDECEHKEDVRQLLSIILEESPKLPIRFMLSGRPEPEIRDQMAERFGDWRSQVILHELDNNEVQADMMTYLRAGLAPIQVSETDLTYLAQRAGTLFIYAATVIRYIGADNFNQNPRSRLEEIINSSNPSEPAQHEGIDPLYSTILGTAFNNPSLRRIDRENMRQVLHTVVCAQEPLTVQALSGLLDLKDASCVYAALRPLWSVLHITRETEFITVLHASFPDYLLDPVRAGTAQPYYCEAGAHHSTLVRRCFDTIENARSFNICELASSFVLDKQVNGIKKLIEENISTQLRYSCQFWVHHLDVATEIPELKMRLLAFLSNRLLLWMEVMNLHRLSSIGAECMYRAKMWVTRHKISEPQDLRPLVHDAWRFTTTFAFHPVSGSTPHLYVSMLPFWPESSPLGKIYATRLRGAVGILGTAMQFRQPALIAKRPTAAPVQSVSFSPDGTNVVLAFSRTIGVMDAFSRQMVKYFKGHEREITCISFSRDGSRAVSSSRNKDICVWDTRDWRPLGTPITGLEKSASSVIFSNKSDLIVSGSVDRTVCVWDAETGDLKLGPLKEHSDTVTSVAMSSKGSRIYSGSKDRSICLWDAQTGDMKKKSCGHRGHVTSIVLSPDDSRLYSGSEDHTIIIWDGQTGEKLSVTPLIGHMDQIRCIAISPDGAYLASGANDRSVLVWDAVTGNIVQGPLRAHNDNVYSVAFSPDGSRIISGSKDRCCYFWDAESSLASLDPTPWHKHAILSIDISPDGKHLLTGSFDKTIFVWDLETGKKTLGPLTGHRDKITTVCFSPDGKGFASGSYDMSIRVWDIQTSTSVVTFRGTNRVRAIAYSPDASMIVSGYNHATSPSDPVVCLWDLRLSRMTQGVLQGHDKSILSVAFSPSGDQFVSVSASREACVQVWDTQSGQQIIHIPHEAGAMLSVAFSPDGARIACGDTNKNITIYQVSTGLVLLGPLQEHNLAVNSVRYSADGRRIFSGSDDGTVCIWDVQDGKLKQRFLGHIGPVKSIAISPDGTRIISASDDMAIRVWDAQWLNPLPIERSTGLLGAEDRPGVVAIPEPARSNPTDLAHPARAVESVRTPAEWTLDKDGWVTVQSDRQIWVPSDLRDVLMRPQNTTLLASTGYLELDINDALLGELWAECYQPI